MSIKLDFMKGTIEQDVAYLGQRMLEGAIAAANQVAELVLGYAQVRVHVDTGTLRDSGRVERGIGPVYSLGHVVTVRVLFGGNQFTNPKTGKPCDYAAIVETKYPFLRPAWEDAKPEAIAILKRRVVEATE